MKEVLQYAKIAWAGDSKTNPQLWMGITNETSEGNFVYHSDGQSQKLSWSLTRGYVNTRSNNCLLVHHSYSPNLNHMLYWPCSATLAAICEWVI